MANKQEVAEFLQFLQLTNSWKEGNLPGSCLASLAAHLPDVAVTSVVELMSSHNTTLALKMSEKLLPVLPFDSTWSNFARSSETRWTHFLPTQKWLEISRLPNLKERK
jgi:hypothetical protein